MPEQASHVFISYVRENQRIVDRLAEDLEANGIQVWLDRNNIKPGMFWKDAINDAIHTGAFFIACFSKEYAERSKNYMNDELLEAIDILRQTSTSQQWFLPVLLNDCDLPSIRIGGGLRLADIDHVDLKDDWNHGVSRLLSTILPADSNVSSQLSIIVPFFNNEGVIGNSVSRLLAHNLHRRYKVILCDDASSDNSLEEVKNITKEQKNFTLLRNNENGNKVGAVELALLHVDTPFVLLIDADSAVHEIKNRGIDNVVDIMNDKNISALGFRIRPPGDRLIERLQNIDYLLFTDSLRRMLGVVICLVGQGVVWRTNDLRRILAEHTGIFEGDDLESTMRLACTASPDLLTYESENLYVSTITKKSIGSLFSQRSRIWAVGLLHCFVDVRSIWSLKGPYGAFFRGIFITEILAHPFKLLSIIPVFFIGVMSLFAHSQETPFAVDALPTELYVFTYWALDVLLATTLIYVFLWLLNIVSIVVAEAPNILQIARWILYFSIYMASPFVYLIWPGLYLLISSSDPFEIDLVIYWWTPGLILTYLWWWCICFFLISMSRESLRRKIMMCCYSIAMPFYYLFIFAGPRTVGFLIFIVARLTGKFSPRVRKA